MITYIQFFSDSMAATLSNALGAAGFTLPVWGQVTDPATDTDRVEVRVNGTEEVIPGNLTTRVDCTVELVLHTADAANADTAQQTAQRVGDVVLEVLRRPWHRVPLPHPQPGTDAEYDAMPFIVLDLLPEAQNMSTEDGAWRFSADFRAYVQF